MSTNETITALADRLSRENEALRTRVDAIASQLTGLEEHLFSVERALAQPIADDSAPGVAACEPQACDIERLARENTGMRAKLAYCARVLDAFESSVLSLSDVMRPL